MKIRLKLGQKVIIFNQGKYLPAVIIGRSVMMKRRTFDVRTETGYEIPYIPVDDATCQVFIDSEKTLKFIEKISTNLNENTQGNVK